MAVLRFAWKDIRTGLWRILPNQIAGSFLVPGVLRMFLLRIAGLDVRSASIGGGCRFTRPNLSIGRWTFINEGAFFEAQGKISVGEHTLFGPNASILTSTHDLKDGVVEPGSYGKPVQIGSYCWIGANVTICPGVTIGDFVVVGAGAVITRDLLDPGTYVGVPARLLQSEPDRTGGAGSSDSTTAAKECGKTIEAHPHFDRSKSSP